MLLVGRARELEAIEAWQAGQGRLLTIAGPAGVGKSRLAQDLATRSGKAIVCALAGCRSAADVERALQRGLGRVSRARLGRALAVFEGLVVLDRFEHLVTTARELVESWVATPGPRFVVTSREPLGLLGETTLLLGPLEETDAISLYAARAKRKVEPRLAAKIVARLDRLPLAIELAAARATVLSDEDLFARLAQGIDGGLRSTIVWSIDLLEEAERLTLLDCAIFRGPFDAKAAESVVLGGPDTVGCLVALERKNLIRRVGGGLGLYDAVREVAFEELARTGRLEAIATRHAEHHLRSFETSRVADLAAAEAFMRDRDPVSAAKLAIALDLALVGQTPSSAHIDLLSSAVDCAERAGDDVVAAKALHARARAFRLRGAVKRANHDLRRALAIARGAGARDVEADVLRLLGVTARQRSRPHRARALLRSALAIQEELGRGSGAAMALDDLGVVAHDLGELAEARSAYERAVSLARVAGDKRFEGIALGHLGVVAHDLGTLDEALRFQEVALEKHQAAEDRRFEGFAHAFIAAIRLEMGSLEEAQQSIDAALAIDARLGDVDSGAVLAGIACAVAAAGGRFVEGQEIIARARQDLAGREDSALRRALDVFALSLVLAEARRAKEEGRHGDAQAHREGVRSVLEAAPPRSTEERLARRVIAKMLDRAGTIDVARDGSWFEADGRRISLTTRRSLAGLLARLAQEQTVGTGRSVAIEALFEAGWPGERVAEKSARRRVYVAIDTLRSLGLGAAILQQDRGYFLDPAVQVVTL
jgi:predicted ATPase